MSRLFADIDDALAEPSSPILTSSARLITTAGRKRTRADADLPTEDEDETTTPDHSRPVNRNLVVTAQRIADANKLTVQQTTELDAFAAVSPHNNVAFMTLLTQLISHAGQLARPEHTHFCHDHGAQQSSGSSRPCSICIHLDAGFHRQSSYVLLAMPPHPLPNHADQCQVLRSRRDLFFQARHVQRGCSLEPPPRERCGVVVRIMIANYHAVRHPGHYQTPSVGTARGCRERHTKVEEGETGSPPSPNGGSSQDQDPGTLLTAVSPYDAHHLQLIASINGENPAEHTGIYDLAEACVNGTDYKITVPLLARLALMVRHHDPLIFPCRQPHGSSEVSLRRRRIEAINSGTRWMSISSWLRRGPRETRAVLLGTQN